MSASVRFDDFAQAVSACETADQAWDLITRTAAELGYHSVDYGLASLRSAMPQRPDDFTILHHLSTFDWAEQYAERQYQLHDRMTRTALQRLTPYSYAEIWSRPYESERQREMENDIVAHGVRSGLNVPLHGPGQTFAALSLGSQLDDAERRRLEAETLPVVYLIAALFNQRMQQLLGPPGPAHGGLSGRERECLLWAARGKTAWETSIILSVSESAVKKYLATAAAKLGARTRTQAVAQAIRQGLIRP